MKWARHQPHARMKTPAQATVNFHGDVLFNVKVVRQIIMESKYVEIFFSSENGILQHIGFRFQGQQTVFSNSLKFRSKTRNQTFSQAAAEISPKIATEIGIKNHTAKRFPLEFDSESEMWFIDVSKGELIDTSNYKH